MTPQSFSLIYNRRMIRRAIFRFFWHSLGIRFLFALVLLAISLGILLKEGDTSWATGALATCLILIITFGATLFGAHYQNALLKLKAMGGPHATFTIEETSFAVSSGAGSANLPWSSIVEVWQFADFWLLFFSKAQFITLPLANLPPDTQSILLGRIRNAGGKIKNFAR